MIKYIVTWCILISGPVEQTYEVHTDEFGREQYEIVWKDPTYEDCDHIRVFENKDSAKVFYNRAIRESDIINVSIDSIVPSTILNKTIINKENGWYIIKGDTMLWYEY